jgi:hypothetical protein
MLAHELPNPLAPILNSLEIIIWRWIDTLKETVGAHGRLRELRTKGWRGELSRFLEFFSHLLVVPGEF